MNIKIFIKKKLILFCGILVTASCVTLTDVALGMILNDWSGVHPYYRFFQLPIFFLLGCIIGIFISIFYYLKIKKLMSSYSNFKLGLILGCIGFGSLVHPFFNSKYTDWVSMLIVLFFSILNEKSHFKWNGLPLNILVIY